MALKTWRLLKQRAELQREASRRRLALAERRLEAARQLLQRIDEYRDDVNASQLERMHARILSPQIAPGAVAVYMRLGDAKVKQQGEIDSLLKLRDATLEDLRAADAQVSQFDKLIDMELSELAAMEARREQKATDEITNAKMAHSLLEQKRQGRGKVFR